MYQIDDITAVPTQPAIPTDNIGSAGFFTGGNPPSVPATRVRFWWLNLVQQSLINLLTATGLAPSKSDSSLVLQAVSIIGRRVVAFSASGSWTVPALTTRVKVTVVGGGGGAGASLGTSYGGGGGGAGGFAQGYVAVTPGTVIPIVVGAGGLAGGTTSGVYPGGNGGTSSFGSLLSATGGQGGFGGAASNYGGTGGMGYGGNIVSSGGSAGDDGQAASQVFTGNGGAGPFGGAGRAATQAFAIVQNGVAPGAGAGGAYAVPSGGGGGTGAAGIVILEY